MTILFITTFILSLSLTALIRRYALHRQVLDLPNERSSHSIPTPRGGGLAIVVAFVAACGALLLLGQLDSTRFSALTAALWVAAIGFLDDHQPVAARWRFLVHFLTALAALFFLQGLPLLQIAYRTLDLGVWGDALGIVALVWSLNLFNFMDGTDGIAASQALFVTAALAGFVYFIDPTLAGVAGCLGAAAAGFLCWNRPPAKIFMGDVGSGFLGLVLGLLILMAAQQAAVMLWVGIILYAVFVADASYTLLYRMLSGQAWYSAHCSHAYQRVAKRYGHGKVLVAVWLINLGWLLPIALAVFRHPSYAPAGVALAYVPLLYLTWHFNAGRAEPPVTID